MLSEFDLLLCSGNGYLSRKIKAFNYLMGVRGPARQITHAAIVTKSVATQLRHVFESTTLNKYCGKRGVQKNPFGEWLRNYNGRVWCREFVMDTNMADHLLHYEFIEDHLDDGYESGIPGLIQLIKCGLRINTKESLGKLFCTELVVNDLMNMSIMKSIENNEEIISSNFPPYTFWDGGDLEKYLNYELKPAELLKG